jgi:hypothetical protein
VCFHNLYFYQSYTKNQFLYFIFLVINGKEVRHTTSDDIHRTTQQHNGDLSPVDSDSISRVSQADSGLVTTSSWSSRSRRDSPTSNSYRHSAASSIDSGRSSTALYDSPKVMKIRVKFHFFFILSYRHLLYRVLWVYQQH